MFRVLSHRYLVLATVVFAASGTSAAIAQSASGSAGNTQAGTYSAQAVAAPQPPIWLNIEDGGYFAKAGTGSGSAAAAAGTVSPSNHINGIGVSTAAPGKACTVLPGTDIPYECE
jgi:hypothetical protein